MFCLRSDHYLESGAGFPLLFFNYIADVDELIALARANGYERGAYVENNRVGNKKKHGNETKKD
jgi:hypothetical protein